MLLGLAIMVALAGLDAWNDRTPRKPFEWRRPDLDWWVTKRTRRERSRVSIALGTEKRG